jgi:hypothetical protein
MKKDHENILADFVKTILIESQKTKILMRYEFGF